MALIKLVAPDGIVSISLGGQEYVVGKKGVTDIPEEHALNLYQYGWKNPDGSADVPDTTAAAS